MRLPHRRHGPRGARRRHTSRVFRPAGLAVAGTLVAASALIGAPCAAAAAALTGHSVGVIVADVSPTTPSATDSSKPVIFALTLVNHSDQTLNGLQVSADRGVPIESQRSLDAAIAKPGLPADTSLIGTVSNKSVTVSLQPASTASVRFATSSSLANPGTQLCICSTASIYPIFFTVRYTTSAGASVTVGSAQTYLPAFDTRPKPVPVSWLWPVIDRPHLLTEPAPGSAQEPVFTDDDLAASVLNGRLARVLDVATRVVGSVPMTLVVDPELINELAIMSTGRYRVKSGTGTVPGTGADAAQQWLTDLQAVLANPRVELAFTAPADPDIETLSNAGLSWRSSLDAAQQQQVTAALGGNVGQTGILWPNGETLDSTALDAAAAQGSNTVVLNSRTLPARSADVNALTALSTASGPMLAAVTSAGIQRYVSRVLSVGGAGTAALPELAAEVAMQTIAAGSSTPYVVITPPRTIDPAPDIAVRAILATAHSSWSTAVPLGAATAAITPVQRGRVVGPRNAPGLPDQVVQDVTTVEGLIPALQSMLQPSAATTLLSTVPDAVQRAESSAWITDRSGGIAFAGALAHQLEAISSAVYIQQPATGAYTLASRSSPLPLTIDNTLPYPVQVKVRVSAVDGLPGFSAPTAGLKVIPAASRLTLKIATHVERTGHFQVTAELITPSNAPIGEPVVLSVRSTALGTIGVIITIVAGAVLVLALLVRLWLRLRHRRGGSKPAPVTVVTP